MQPINAKIIEKDGKIGISVKDQDYFDSQLRMVGIGNNCSVQIDKPVIPGTDRQRKFVHALIGEFYYTGMHSMPEFFRSDPDGFKVYLKELFAKSRDKRTPSSFSKYNKYVRMDFISFIISYIHQSGAYNESKKLQDIIQGAENSGYYGLKG